MIIFQSVGTEPPLRANLHFWYVQSGPERTSSPGSTAWMDGWMDVWMYGWVYGWMYEWMDVWMDVWMYGWMGMYG